MLKIKGKLVYDPTRKNFRKDHKQRTLIIEFPKDQLDLYYQWFLSKQFGTWYDIQRPMWGLHCTIVKGNEFIHKDKLNLWKKYEGQVVEVEYDPTTLSLHWEFWTMNVKSDMVKNIRDELGLGSSYKPHITVGRLYDWQPKGMK
jgi:hypothetical protein